MKSFAGKGRRHIFFITAEDMVVIRQKVIRICIEDANGRLFGLTDEPGDLGIKDQLLLQSALDRQLTGVPHALKYDTAFTNAATLAFGLCANHPYLDGNKRTALIATLAHLDKNGIMPSGFTHKVMADVMENVADRRVPLTAPPTSAEVRKPRHHGKVEESVRADDTQVIEALSKFLECNSHQRSKDRAQNLRYGMLRKIIERHGFMLRGPNSNTMEIMKPKPASLLQKMIGRHRESLTHVTSVGWPGDSKSVRPGALSLLREKLRMREEDGFDDLAFYSIEEAVDPLINEYRGVLRRLRNR
jgi:death-on-curing protein